MAARPYGPPSLDPHDDPSIDQHYNQNLDQEFGEMSYVDEKRPGNNPGPGSADNSSFTRTDSAFSESTTSSGRKRLRDVRPPQRRAQPILKKAPQEQTEYMGMLLHQSMVIEKTPLWNVLAAGCTWILLAGFIVLPGTYVGLQNSGAEEDGDDIQSLILDGFENGGLLILASVLCGLGALGVVGLWFKWRRNYTWLINRVLLPGLLNSTMGLISTLVNVLSKQPITFNSTATATTIVTASLATIFSCMFLFYNNYLLASVKADHRKAYGDQDVKETLANAGNGSAV